MIKRWSQKEIEFIRKNYSNIKDKELSKKSRRSIKAISYMACKLGLKKNRIFYCKSRKKLNFDITKKQLIRLYVNEKNSIRDCAQKLGVSKNTVDYYLKKFKLKSRNKSKAGKEGVKRYGIWCKGLSKETDKRLKRTQEKMIQIWKKRREEQIKKIEFKFKMSIPKILNYLYWNKKLTQEKISKKLGVCRGNIIKLMKEYNIKLRPNYEYISSLKGKKHPMYGKTWEEIYGIERAKKIRKMHSICSRNLIIKRIENNEFPFFNTEIEKSLAKEMQKRDIQFVKQFNVDNKFVCDFAIPYFKLIIECDGDYWHANPSIYNRNNLHKSQIKNLQRDKFKDKYLKRKGWKVIRFYESDIKNKLIKCISKIEKHINITKK